MTYVMIHNFFLRVIFINAQNCIYIMQTVTIDKSRYEDLLKTEKLFKLNFELEDFENPNFLGYEKISEEESKELDSVLQEESVSITDFLKQLQKNV